MPKVVSRLRCKIDRFYTVVCRQPDRALYDKQTHRRPPIPTPTATPNKRDEEENQTIESNKNRDGGRVQVARRGGGVDRRREGKDDVQGRLRLNRKEGRVLKSKILSVYT